MIFPVHTVETAPENSRPMLEKIVANYGFLPNLAGGLAESPALLQAFLGLAGAFDSDQMTLDAIERQVVLLTVSATNGCHYCTAAHSMVSEKLGLERDEIDRIVRNETLADPELDALRLFTKAVTEQRGHLDDDEVDAFLGAGFSRPQVLEILLGVTTKTLTNYANHVIKPEINEQFAAYAPRRAA